MGKKKNLYLYTFKNMNGTRSLVGVKICLHVIGNMIAKYRSMQIIIRINIDAV